MIRDLKVLGVGRDAANEQSMWLSLSARPTDDEVRDLHEHLRKWRPKPAPPPYPHVTITSPDGSVRYEEAGERNGTVVWPKPASWDNEKEK